MVVSVKDISSKTHVSFVEKITTTQKDFNRAAVDKIGGNTKSPISRRYMHTEVFLQHANQCFSSRKVQKGYVKDTRLHQGDSGTRDRTTSKKKES